MRVARLLLKAAATGLALAMCMAVPSVALGQTHDKDSQKALVVDSSGIDFGDDTSRWANDGECDDPRFSGPAADENLQDVDRLHDATDCRTAYESGQVTFAGDGGSAAIDFGDDASQYANDGECDDPRFTGSGAAANNLEADKNHDATDCKAAYDAGTVTYTDDGTGGGTGTGATGIDFGDDTSDWANDGECDDPRFTGAGANANNTQTDLGRDATDCRTAYDAGTVSFSGDGQTDPGMEGDAIDFGDDTSQYANDGECDDPRFAGTGANANNLEADKNHDATDCKAAYDAGTVTYSGEGDTGANTSAAIDFGDDTSQYANDGECDDPRFTGTGANANNLEADKSHDATDCKAAYDAGTVTYSGEGDTGQGGTDTGSNVVVEFGDDASQFANDGECDDPRFTGPGAAANNVEADLGHDATDCRTAYEAAQVTLSDPGVDTNDLARIEFGDDASQYANDGECDDPRFAGTGANANNLEADRGHDATDCRAAYEAGTIVLQQASGEDTSETVTPTEETGTMGGEVEEPETTPAEQTGTETGATSGSPDFGANDGQWTNDGQCDDPRFEGPGAATEQVEADLMHDADDCKAAFEAGNVTLRSGETGTTPATTEGGSTEQGGSTSGGDTGTPAVSGSIDFGDDSGAWVNDGDCDDPRFAGTGVAEFVVSVDIGKDASDCRTAVEAGQAALKPVYAAEYVEGAPYSEEGIDFGDNTSVYSSNDQCDDPRFEGPGMADAMLQSDIMHDSVDCRAAYIAGTIALKVES